jgi:ankyrin repeat protein
MASAAAPEIQLLKYPADPNIKTERGSPLLFAIGSGSRRIVELVLEKGVNPNEPQVLRTSVQREDYSLNFAIQCGGLEMVEMLLKNKASLQIPLFSPLMTAVMYNQAQIAGALLHAGADVNAAEIVPGYSSPTSVPGSSKPPIIPLQYAVARCGADIVEMLLNNKADANRIDDKSGNSLLHFAVYQLHNIQSGDHRQARIAALLAERANPNVVNKRGDTPLSLALEGLPSNSLSYSVQSLKEFVKILREHGAR